MGKEDLAEAQKLFDQAVELDRAFPDPYVFRALTGIVGVFSGYATSPSEVLKEADGFAQRALQLDQGNALAHTIFGRLLTFAGKHEAAIAENRLSIELNPNLALAHYGLGAALLWSGHADRSIPHLEQALRLSPRDPLSPVWRNAMSMALTFMGDDAGALVARDEALRQLHNVMFAALRPVSLVGLGRFDEARASVAESLAQNPRLSLRFIAQSMPGLYSVYLTLLLDRLREAGLPE